MAEVIVICVLFGIVAGLLAGMFGLGGGIVLVPFLIWLLPGQGISEHIVMVVAVATSLATIIVTSIAAVIAHHKLGTLLWDVVLRLTPGLLAGGFLGALIADQLPADVFKRIFAIYLMLVSLRMALQMEPETGSKKLTYTISTAYGLVIGGLSVILGIGGGTLTVPLLVKCRFPMKNAVAISSACGLPIAVTGSVSYIWLGWNQTEPSQGFIGYIYLPAFLAIILTSTFLAPVGALLAVRLKTRILKRLFSLLLLLIALRILY